MAETGPRIPQPPHSGTTPHPLWLSQLNSSAPVQHIYHPTQPDEGPHTQRYRAEPSRIPIQHSSTKFSIDHGAPLAQGRQSRKIVQRRTDLPKDRVHADRESALSQVRLEGPNKHGQPRDQETDSYVRRDSVQTQASSGGAQSPQSLRSVPISGLLSNNSRFVHCVKCSPYYRYLTSSSGPKRPSYKYKIELRQQPVAARACGFGERDRRVVDPPPILQLSIDDPVATQEDKSAELRALAFSVVHCTLWNPATNTDDSAMPGSSDKRQQRRLMGTLVSSPFVGLDEHDVEGCFFTFPDLSVRTPGTYCLKFSLVILDPGNMGPGSKVPIRTTVKSEIFNVYNAKDFGGMRPSTELTKRLKHQGCLIQVKKGNTKSCESHPRDEEEDEEDEDEEDEGDISSVRRGKRSKR